MKILSKQTAAVLITLLIALGIAPGIVICKNLNVPLDEAAVPELTAVLSRDAAPSGEGNASAVASAQGGTSTQPAPAGKSSSAAASSAPKSIPASSFPKPAATTNAVTTTKKTVTTAKKTVTTTKRAVTTTKKPVVTTKKPVTTTKKAVTTTKKATTTAPNTTAATKSSALTAAQFADEVLRLTNAERTANGLSALSRAPAKLWDAVLIRAREASQEFSHTRPDGRNCFTVLADFGISYTRVGENLQWSTNNSPKLAVDQWMSSPGHRANILNPEFKMLAVAYYGNTCAQLFLTQ